MNEIKDISRGGRAIVFFDGDCGLCDRFVRCLFHADGDGTLFWFAPLGGEYFNSTVGERDRAHLPESLVILTHYAELITQSDAVRYTLGQLPGAWLLPYLALSATPRPLRDIGYPLVAASRRRLGPRRDRCEIHPDAGSRFKA